MSEAAMDRVAELLRTASYDICVLTGDYRGQTFGPYAEAIAGVGRLREHLNGPIYGVLGNHDTIRMVPAFEEMGIKMLLNEQEKIERGGAAIHLAGVDDAHFYRMDNIEKAAQGIPHDAFSILLSHTPEIYRQAAHADFNVLLAGHTHGGPRRHSRHAQLRPAALHGEGQLQASRHDWLHLGRRWCLHRAGALQLPAGDHAASFARVGLGVP